MWVKVRYTDAAYYDGQLVDAVATIKVTPYKNRTPGAGWGNPNYGNSVYYPTIQVSDLLYGGWVWQNVNDFQVDIQLVPKGANEDQALVLSNGESFSDDQATYYTVNSLDPTREQYRDYGNRENPGAVYGPESALPGAGTTSEAYVVEGSHIKTSYDGGPNGTQYAYNGGTTPWGESNSNIAQDKPGHSDWSLNSVLFMVAPGETHINVTLGNLERRQEQQQVPRTNYVWGTISTASFTPANAKGKVVVQYVNTEGETIKTEVVDTPEQSLVTSEGKLVEYNTAVDHKPETISKTESLDGKDYRFKEVSENSKPEIGTLVKGTTTVIYVYEATTGDVNAQYVVQGTNDQLTGITVEADGSAGTVDKTRVIKDDAPVGDKYNDQAPSKITTADGKVYTLVGPRANEGDAQPTGEVKSTPQTITYEYELAKGDVTAQYVVKGTEEQLTGATVEADGSAGSVDKTRVIKDDAPVGDKYNDQAPSKITTADGKVYTLVGPRANEGDAQPTGEVKSTLQTITYEYELAKGDVTVKYVDEDGTPISGEETDGQTEVPVKEQADTGEAYDTTPQRPTTITTPSGDKYVYVKVEDGSDPETGKVKEEPQTVTYVYRKVEQGETTGSTTGQVIVHYEDTEGNNLQDSVTDTDGADVGTSYDTTDHKDARIEKDGSTYVLVPSKTKGDESGDVVEGTTEVTYVYQKVAKWVPEVPGVPEEDRPTTDYPFDPEHPDDEIPAIPTNPDTDQPVVPYVPGYTPEDPTTGTPLTPVDPEDPSKGYVPPVPTDPGVDTHIPYVKDPEPVKPQTPMTPTSPKTPTETPEQPAQPTVPPVSSQPVTPNTPVSETPVAQQSVLPQTGESDNAALVTGAGLLMTALGFLGIKRRRKED